MDCETTDVGAIISEIAEVVVSGGGFLSAQLTIREREGNLTGLAPPASRGMPLIRLPDSVMPPVSEGNWKWSADGMEVTTDPAGNRLFNRLLELHASLYSATGKARWYRSTHPRGVVKPASATFHAIRKLRPGFAAEPDPEGFLKTRTYGRGDPHPLSLIPIADLLNHHRHGAPLAYRHGHLVVDVRQPTETTECFVNYGHFRRDPLDLALQYGYCDAFVRVATSAPVQVELPGLGGVEVLRRLPPPKSLADPPTLERTPLGWRLSHLTFQANQPQRLVVPLTMMARASGSATPEVTARNLLGFVIDENLALLANLTATLDGESPMGSMLIDACRYQARNFSEVAAAVA